MSDVRDEAPRADIRIGLSGWTYTPWRGAFYPKGLRQKDELAYIASLFPSVEINGTFYGLQRPQSFAAWEEATPADFVFSVKGPRYITHILRLRNCETPLANFLASGPLRLGQKLGPLLWQLPPNMAFDPETLEAFLRLLPRTPDEACALAARHDDRLRAPAWIDCNTIPPLRHALEIRHESFRTPELLELLRRYNVALVCADTVAWPLLMDLTADFVYCRLHGSTELYRSRYSEADLDRWSARIEAWSRGLPMKDGNFIAPPEPDGKPRQVFLYFDNTDKMEAPANALDLMRRVCLEWHPLQLATVA